VPFLSRHCKGSRGDHLLLHYVSLDRLICHAKLISTALAPDLRDTLCHPNLLFPTRSLTA
jgi:hypothetical protein